MGLRLFCGAEGAGLAAWESVFGIQLVEVLGVRAVGLWHCKSRHKHETQAHHVHVLCSACLPLCCVDSVAPASRPLLVNSTSK